MKMYYIWDALCGWCYGFGAILTPFLANHPEIEVEIISGGLFINERSMPIRNFGHIPTANERISEMFGVRFGENYQKMLEKGDEVLNSYHAAKGFSILKEKLPQNKQILLAKVLQEAFYIEGKSLSAVETYKEIVEKFDISSEEINNKLKEALAKSYAEHQDFKKAITFGVQSYPTLILEHHGKYYDLKGNAITLADLEKNLEKIIQ